MPEEESFKVTDRRRRSTDAAEAEPDRASATVPGGDAQREQSPRSPTPAGHAPEGHAAEKPDLQALFIMFASSALIHLGDAPDPVTGEQRVDLSQAQQAIDVLLLLRDKTQGNRTDQESRILEQIIYDLQMRFVEATRATSG